MATEKGIQMSKLSSNTEYGAQPHPALIWRASYNNSIQRKNPKKVLT